MKTEFERIQAEASRREAVKTMNVNLAKEGITLSDRDLRLQSLYIAGLLNTEDLILDAQKTASEWNKIVGKTVTNSKS